MINKFIESTNELGRKIVATSLAGVVILAVAQIIGKGHL